MTPSHIALSATQLKFLQRLAASKPERRVVGEAAALFASEYGLGRLVGAYVFYEPRHWEEARKLLLLGNFPVEPMPAGAYRADVAEYQGLSEKSFSRAPWADSVAVKRWVHGAAAPADDMNARPDAFTVMTVDQAVQLRCGRVLVVENLETFRFIETYHWVVAAMEEAARASALKACSDSEVAARANSTLVLFRGDMAISNRDSQRLLQQRSEPTYAFFDFDPAGLGIAASLPRLHTLLLPPAPWLQRTAAGPRGLELFAKSVGQYQRTLDECKHAGIAASWRLMQGWRAGVAQEAMRSLVKS